MNEPLPLLLQCVSRALRAHVQPELQTDYARSQLAGALDILAKLERMADWLPAMNDEVDAALRAGNDALVQAAVGQGLHPPAPNADSPADRSRELSDWLFAAGLDDAAASALHGILRESLRASLLAQRKRIPRADFSAMTASSE